MRIKHTILITLLAVAIVGCNINPNQTATPTISPKQPEPGRPLVGGEISGVLDNALITIHVRTPKGWESRSITRQGNGSWSSVVTDASGIDYIVTAEANGYVSVPVSYTIYLNDTNAYVVEDGQMTTKEAVHLDFYFDPVVTATPTK